MLRVVGLALVLWLAAGQSWAVEDLVLAGSDALYRGDAAGARQALAEAVARDPGDDFAVNQLGLALTRLERFAEARARFETVARRSPDNVFSLLWLGILDLREDDAQGAVARFRSVLDAAPDHPTALYLLGAEAASRRDLARAAGFFRRAGRAGRDDPETQYRLAEAYRGLDMPENARLCYERTLELAPRHHRALTGLGWLRYAEGRRDAAVFSWERALAASPDQPEARAALAAVLVREGIAFFETRHPDAARGRFARALVHEPRNKAALYYLRRLPPPE